MSRHLPSHQLLQEVLDQCPRALIDVDMLRALLLDTFTNLPQRVELVYLIARFQLPSRIQKDPSNTSLLLRELHRVAQLSGLSTEVLAPAVYSWAKALGGNIPIPRACGDVEDPTTLSDPLPSIRLVLWMDLPLSSAALEACRSEIEPVVHDIFVNAPGVKERLLFLHRVGALERLKNSRQSVQHRHEQETERLHKKYGFPKPWLRAGVNDALQWFGFPRIEPPRSTAATESRPQTEPTRRVEEERVPEPSAETEAPTIGENTLSGHAGSVYSVSWSPDGRFLASGSGDRTIKIWNAATGREEKTLRGHTNSVRSVSWSPDGRTLASGSSDNTIKIWNAATGREEKTLSGHTNSVYSVSWSPDGRFLASGSLDNTIKIWPEFHNVGPVIEVEIFQDHDLDGIQDLMDADISEGKDCDSDGVIDEYQLKNNDCDENGVLDSCELSSDTDCDENGILDLCELVDRDQNQNGILDACEKLLRGHTNSVRSVSWSPDGRFLASGSYDNWI
ncbi:WD40 repeat domain-containing protein [Planctomycetota bacterium]|nr:WD40 repeat domain-containing protein [Planctomycetota bacterium]